MKPSQFISRKLGLGLFAAILVIGFGVVVARPAFISIQVTTLRVESGSLSPAIFGIGTVEARRSYFIGPTAARQSRACGCGGSGQGRAVAGGNRPRGPGCAPSLDRSCLCPGLPVLSPPPKRNARCVLARHQLAELNAKRYRDLGGKNFVSASAVEGKQQELDSAQAALGASELIYGALAKSNFG